MRLQRHASSRAGPVVVVRRINAVACRAFDAATADYADGVETALPPDDGLTAEDWARACLQEAPRALRWFVVVGWRVVLGLRLGPLDSPDHVLGWNIIGRRPDEVVLESRSPFLTARLVFHCDGTRLTWSTFVHHDRKVAAVAWPPVSLLHRRIVPYALRTAMRNEARQIDRRGSLLETGASKPPGVFRRAFSRLATTRGVLFFSRHVSWKVDPALLRLTRGRVSSTLMIPTGVLQTRGVRTGEVRRHAVIYWRDGEATVIAASHAGRPDNPSWYYNLRATPDVTFGDVRMRATIVEEEGERSRLWALGDRVFPAFVVYRARAAAAGRTIPLIRLEPGWR